MWDVSRWSWTAALAGIVKLVKFGQRAWRCCASCFEHNYKFENLRRAKALGLCKDGHTCIVRWGPKQLVLTNLMTQGAYVLAFNSCSAISSLLQLFLQLGWGDTLLCGLAGAWAPARADVDCADLRWAKRLRCSHGQLWSPSFSWSCACSEFFPCSRSCWGHLYHNLFILVFLCERHYIQGVMLPSRSRRFQKGFTRVLRGSYRFAWHVPVDSRCYKIVGSFWWKRHMGIWFKIPGCSIWILEGQSRLRLQANLWGEDSGSYRLWKNVQCFKYRVVAFSLGCLGQDSASLAGFFRGSLSSIGFQAEFQQSFAMCPEENCRGRQKQ